MNDELSKSYGLLGVAPGTSGRELKQAYHDMAKVWHPDRFSHDPRLQQKAQEKLKEINEAYELLSTGRAAKASRPTPPPQVPYETPAAPVRRTRRKSVLPVVAIFCAAFVAALIYLSPSDMLNMRVRRPTDERQAAQSGQEAAPPVGEVRPAANQSARGGERVERRPAAEATSGPAPNVQQLRPMQTVTVNIDSATGQLATKDCPAVSQLTYPAGEEPRQYCTATHKERAKDSRLKTVAKRVVTPGKWLGDGKSSASDEARDAPPSGTDRPQNR